MHRYVIAPSNPMQSPEGGEHVAPEALIQRVAELSGRDWHPATLSRILQGGFRRNGRCYIAARGTRKGFVVHRLES